MLTKKDLIRHIVKHEYHDMGKKTTSCIDPKDYDQRT